MAIDDPRSPRGRTRGSPIVVVPSIGAGFPESNHSPANGSLPADSGNFKGSVEVSQHIAQNIEAICAVYSRAEERVHRHQRIVEQVTAFVGRPAFPYGVLAFIALWVLGNAALATPFDPPPYPRLQGLVTVCALLISTVVLITQNRQARVGEQRAHLELQIGLLAEQKIAKLIGLMEELRRDLPSVKNRYDAEAEAMEQPADPHMVLSALEQGLEEAAQERARVESGDDDDESESPTANTE